MPEVLIVEDQEPVSRALALLLDLHGISARVACRPAEAMAALAEGDVDLVLQDMNFSPGETTGAEGIALFRAIRADYPEVPVMLLTAWASLETAVSLVREGARDYVAKPWDDSKLVLGIETQLRVRALERENERLRASRQATREELASRFDLSGVVYESDAMHEVVSLAARVARADVPVLIRGESGTGKERLAELVVANSGRKGKPFVKVNAGALPESLLEAELFGVEAGAYTGADRRREGRFEAAHRGTILLDEIGNLPPSGQAKLLRVLQEGTFERLGSSSPVAVDVRVIAATNVDLEQAIARGTFRDDLYFRLAVIELHVPPLRARRDDLLALAKHLAATLPISGGGPRRPLSAASLRRLAVHPWPGNVRELGNVIQRALLVAAGAEIEPADLGLPGEAPAAAGSGETGERARIEAALVRHAGNVLRTAEELGVSRQALYRRMERLGIQLERRPR